MRFDEFSYITVSGVFQNRKRKGIPDKYQKFLPENVKITKSDNPYGYDPFLIYFNEKADREADDGLYTDRLLMWDYGKHNLLCEKHFGDTAQYWHDRDPKKIQDFLRDWTGKKVVLVVNIQYVNVSNGYPLWFLGYYIEKEEDET